MPNSETSLDAKMSFLSLHTLLQGSMRFCSLTSAWSTGLLFPSQPSLRAASHPALGQKAWSFCVCPANYRGWAHSTQRCWIGILALFYTQTSRKEQLLYQIPMSPGSSYLFILHFPSYTIATTWEEAAETLGGTRSFTHAAQLLPRGRIYWKFHNFVFPSKPPQQELFYLSF